MTFPVFSFPARHKGYQLGKGVSYNGASETTPLLPLHCAYIIRKKRTIFAKARLITCERKEWVVTSN